LAQGVWRDLQEVKVVDGIEIMVERMKREVKELKMGFADHQGIWKKNRRLFFPAFIL